MRNKWSKVLTLVAVAVVGYYGLQAYASVGLVQKFAACSEEAPKLEGNPPYPEAQRREAAAKLIACVDTRANFVERLYFDADEVLATASFE